MARAEAADVQELDEIAAYHEDAIKALNRYFEDWERVESIRYLGLRQVEIKQISQSRIRETELRSILQVLASMEAAFQIDYKLRRKQKEKDPLSRAFRDIYKEKNKRIRLDEDLLGLWVVHHPELKDIIGEFRGVLHLRHWLAHGRHWRPNNWLGYTYEDVETLARSFFARFPLYR